jgi:uncharacterized protein YeaO (DUF488 family)
MPLLLYRFCSTDWQLLAVDTKGYKNWQEMLKCGLFVIRIKRIYQPHEQTDGFRILVDRLWPRGMSKQKAQLDLWLKEVAPSDELRQWFSHEPEKWAEFQKKYQTELTAKQDLLTQIKQLEKEKDTVTLVYSARDTERNNAVALKATLEKK